MKFILERRWSLLLVAAVVLVGPAGVRADDDDDKEKHDLDRRPIEELFKTDTVFPEEKGELEVGTAPLFQHNSSVDIFTIPLTLEYGITSNWQAEVEWNAYVQRNPKRGAIQRGRGDLELSTQYSFLNINDSPYHVAPRFALGIPTGNINKEMSEGFLEYEPGVVLARDLPIGRRTQLFTELSLGFVQRVKRPFEADDAEPAAHEFMLGTGFFTLIPHGALTMELNWNNNRWNNHGTENQLYVTPGVLWRMANSVEFGVGVPVGLNRQSDRFQIAAHFIWEF